MNKDRRLSILLVIGIVALVFLLSRQFFFRLDLTEDHEFTMSKATKSILREIDDPVDVKAYFSGNLPADFELVKNDFQNLLVEYNNISKGKINYRFIDPAKDQTTEQEAMQNGIQPLLINVREKDEASQKKAYMGAIIQYGDQKEVIPFISQGSAMEYELTTAIKKITVKDKPAIGFIAGHGEPGFNTMAQVVQELSVIYSIENINLATEAEIAQRFQAVVLVNPADTIPPDQFAKINDYLAKGGKAFVAVNAVNGDLSTATGTVNNTSVVPWLASFGIQIDPTFIVDAACAKVTVQQQRSQFFSFSSQINFPYLPLISQFPDQPATKGLEAVIFQFASPIKYTAGAQGTFIPMVTSSAKAGIQQAPLQFDVNRQWTSQDFPLSNLVIGGVLDGVAGNPESKMVVFSDADFFVSEQGKVNPDNVSLVVNTIDWMCDKSGLAELRTKGVVYRPIKDLEDGQRTFIKYFNFLLPLALVAAVGIWRTQRNRNIRMRRMQEKYS